MRTVANFAVAIVAWILVLQEGTRRWPDWLYLASELVIPARIGSVEVPFEWPAFGGETVNIAAPTLASAMLVLPWLGLFRPVNPESTRIAEGLLGGLALLFLPLWLADFGNRPGDCFGAPPWLFYALLLVLAIAGARASSELRARVMDRRTSQG